ncbi:Xylosyltransferase oxt, partial [Fragariocoptes setiger]
MTSPNEGPSHGRLVCLTLLIIPCFAICYFEAEQIHEALHSLAERLTLTSEATSNRKQAVPFEDIVDRQPAYLDSTSFDNFDLDGQGCNLRTRDALSAIRRAKTDECKLEIRNLICQIEADPWSFYPSRIDRTCSVNIESAKILGFITLDPSVNFQRIDCPIGLCPDFCFKYGYKYAIYDKNNHSLCYCNHSVGASVNIGTHCEELQCWLLEDTGISSETLRFRIPHVIPPINHSRTSLHLAFLLTVDGRSITGMRFPTIWGGSTLLDMMLSSIEQLLRIDHPWEYLINLSESDFPIKPLNDLENYIASYKNGTIFLKSHGLDNYRFIRKQGLDRIFYQCENRMWRLGPRILPSGLIYSG